jgi:hypothetical protein
VHGGREFWSQAKWLLDLARAVSVVDPQDLRERAREAGAEKSLAIGCAALFDMASSAVPPALRPGSDAMRMWRAMRRRPMTPLRRRAIKTRAADSAMAGLDALARSAVGQVVPT